MSGRPEPGRAYDSHYINSYGRHFDSPAGEIVAFSVEPAITATARHLDVTIRISNWGTTVGCTATLDIAFIRRR